MKLNNGDIDANAFQHIPYLTEQSKQRGYNLAVVGNTFVYPIVAYSKKLKYQPTSERKHHCYS
jgi:D-methionine transport system substrate-binding protein